MTHGQDNKGDMTESELLQRIGELPKRMAPRNDPWPQILDRISAEKPARAPAGPAWFKVAAAVAVAFALGIFLGDAWESLAPGTPAANHQAAQTSPSTTVAASNLGGVLTGVEREYQAAFSEFINIGRTASELKPATLESIQRDWDEMLDAESALSEALEKYPNNPWLNKRMLELRDRQLGMLQQLAGLDRASRRTEI